MTRKGLPAVMTASLSATPLSVWPPSGPLAVTERSEAVREGIGVSPKSSGATSGRRWSSNSAEAAEVDAEHGYRQSGQASGHAEDASIAAEHDDQPGFLGQFTQVVGAGADLGEERAVLANELRDRLGGSGGFGAIAVHDEEDLAWHG
jgi:hypothetical protein